MRPSEVRDIILSEHEQVLALTQQARAEGTTSLEGLAAAFEELVQFLGDHITHEETDLFPILRRDTNWAEVNEAELVKHHMEQRQSFDQLGAFIGAAEGLTDELKARFVAFLDHVEMDVRDENEHILTHQMLHDEPEADGFGA